MAKSVKQQMYEQLANQHVQQALNNIGMQQFQEAYNQWNADQAGLADFQAAYNAWSEANPVQTVEKPKTQSIPVLNKTTDLTDFFTPKTASGTDINKQAAKDIDRRAFNEAYARQQQEEQMLAGRTIKPDDIIQKYAEAKGISMDQARAEYEKAESMKNQTIEKPGEVEIKTLRNVDVANLLNPNKKLTDQEKKDARALAQEELQTFEYGPDKKPILNTPEERQRYADAVNLLNKTNPVSNALTGAIRQPLNLARAVRDAFTNGKKSDVARQNDESMDEAYQAARTQNPAATIGGEIGGQIGMYALTNPLFDSLGAASGLGKVGSFALNQVGQNLQDVALDTLPTLNRYREGGLSDEEKADLLMGVGINAAGNLVMGAAGEGIAALARNRAARNAADEAFRANVAEGAEKLARLGEEGYIPPQKLQPEEIASLNLNPVEANNNQFSELMNTFNHQFKDESAMRNIFTPEDLDASQNAQFKSLMDENLIPERLNPVVEMEMPEDVLTPEEIRALNSEYSWADELPELAKAEDDVKLSDNEIKQLLSKTDTSEPPKVETPESPKAETPKYNYNGGVDNPELTIDQNEKINSAIEYLEGPFYDADITHAVGTEYNKIQSEAGQKLFWDYENALEAAYKADTPEAAQAFKDQAKELRKGLKTIDKAEQKSVNQLMDYWDTYFAVQDYKKALNGADGDAVVAAKRAVDSARNRLARGKGKNSTLQKAFSSNYGKVAGNAAEYYKPTQTDNMDIVQDLIEQDAKNTNKYVRDAEPDRAIKSNTVEGANPLQFFADGDTPKEQWKTGKWRTNTAENTGKIKNPDDAPIKDYAYRVFTEEEQNIAAAERYADVDDITKELLSKDYDSFDEVDVKAAQNEWNNLMDAGDPASLKMADRLGRRIAYEVREGGRIPQALAEFSRNTPEGQMRFVQRSLDDLVDKTAGTGTSEALGNIADKIDEVFDRFGNDKEALKRELASLFDGDMKNHVGGKTAKNMTSKPIKGKNAVLKMIDKGADADAIADVVFKQNGGVKLSPQEKKQIYDLLVEANKLPAKSYAQEEVLARAAKIATSRAPSTIGQKARAVLYANMLGNFKTAISRNFFGNMAYQTLEQGRQPISAAVDKAVSGITKKHSALGINADKMKAYAQGFKQGGADQLRDMRLHIDTGRSGSKGWENALKNNRSTFNGNDPASKFMNNVEYYVGNALELGDRPWFEANYKQVETELHQLIDRYGKNGVAGLEGVSDADLDDVIDIIANVRAADAVFQKQGKMSKGLSDLRNGLGAMSEGAIGVDVLSTSSSPFTLTPGNMLERAIEYTPLGAVKNAVETIGEVAGKKGFNQRRFVDEASRTIAGLPILGGAYALAKSKDSEGERGQWIREHLGSINGGYSEDPDEKQAQIDDGFIEYGYNVPNWVPGYGGMTLDTSDLPVIGPFMQAGAVTAEEGLSPESVMQAGEAVLGGSATQGIRRAFGADNAGYSSQNSIVENLADTVKSAGTQLVPSLARQTAQTMDPYKRDLGEYGTNEYYINSIKNSLPFLRQTMPIKTDIEGNEVLQNQGRSLGSKMLENYLLPMNVAEYTPSELNKEATRLLNATDLNTAFVPKAKRSDLRKWDDQAQKEYTEEQFRDYKKELGTLNSELGHAIIDSDFYKELDDATKAKTLGNVYTGMKAVAKYNATGIGTDDKIANAYMDGGTQGVIDYLTGKNLVSDTGLSSSTTTAKAIQAKAESGDTEAAMDMTEQVNLLPNYGLDLKGPGATYTKAYDVYDGLTAEGFAKTYKGIDTDNSQGLSKKEVIAYMNKQGYGQSEGMKFWKAYAKTEGKSPWKIPVLQPDGSWK